MLVIFSVLLFRTNVFVQHFLEIRTPTQGSPSGHIGRGPGAIRALWSAWQAHRARTLTNVRGRASRVDYVAFWQKVLLHTDMFEEVRKFQKHNYTRTYVRIIPGIR